MKLTASVRDFHLSPAAFPTWKKFHHEYIGKIINHEVKVAIMCQFFKEKKKDVRLKESELVFLETYRSNRLVFRVLLLELLAEFLPNQK